MESCGICPSVSGSFHWAGCAPGSPTLSHRTGLQAGEISNKSNCHTRMLLLRTHRSWQRSDAFFPSLIASPLISSWVCLQKWCVLLSGIVLKSRSLKPVRMVIITQTTGHKRWWGYGEKGTLVHWWWECQLVPPLWKIVRRFLKKLKIEVLYEPAIPLQGVYLKETKTNQKGICTPRLTAALFTIAKVWKQPRCPSTWVDKQCVSHSVVSDSLWPHGL